MTCKKINIAILSPADNVYSETFIQAHREKLDGNIFFYFGLKSSKILEGEGDIKRLWKKNYFKVQRKYLRKTYSWYYDRFLKESFLDKKIDVILAEYGTTGQAYIEIINELNIPLIVHFHGYDAYKKKVIKEHNYYKEVFQTAKFIVAVSQHMAGELIKLGCPPNKIVLNVYGPDDTFFNVTPSFKRKQFIAIGRFVDKKAPYYLILAFREVVKEFPDARLIIAGSGELEPTCRNLVKYYKLAKNVIFPGVISPAQYRDFLAESLAMVQHSITAVSGDSEGTPLSILEASAAGLPVISTKHAGIPDIITNNHSGLLVEEHDVDEMVKQMLHLLESPELAQQLGTNGKNNMKANFTLDRHIKVLNELLNRAARNN